MVQRENKGSLNRVCFVIVSINKLYTVYLQKSDEKPKTNKHVRCIFSPSDGGYCRTRTTRQNRELLIFFLICSLSCCIDVAGCLFPPQ